MARQTRTQQIDSDLHIVTYRYNEAKSEQVKQALLLLSDLLIGAKAILQRKEENI